MTRKQDVDGKYSVLYSYVCTTHPYERVTYILMKYFVVHTNMTVVGISGKKTILLLSLVNELREFQVSGFYHYIPCA